MGHEAHVKEARLPSTLCEVNQIAWHQWRALRHFTGKIAFGGILRNQKTAGLWSQNNADRLSLQIPQVCCRAFGSE